MPGPLPRGWKNKQVAVVWYPKQSGSLQGKLVNDFEEGVLLKVVGGEYPDRDMFIPWNSIRFVELAEEADEEEGTEVHSF